MSCHNGEWSLKSPIIIIGLPFPANFSHTFLQSSNPIPEIGCMYTDKTKRDPVLVKISNAQTLSLDIDISINLHELFMKNHTLLVSFPQVPK